MRGILGLLALLGVAASAEPQSPAPDPQPVVLRGRIVSAANDAALRRARVAAAVPSGRVDPVFTDDEGRFVLTLPSRTAISLTATKAGYAAMTVPVAAAQLSGEVNVHLARGAAITGRILDAVGSPAAGAPVAARRIGSGPGLVDFLSTADDLGEYRIGGLPPGRYLLRTGEASSPLNMVNAIGVFDPSLTTQRILQDSDQVIDVAVGETISAADIALPRRQSAAAMRTQGASPLNPCLGTGTVRARVVTSDGAAVPGASVRLSAKGPTWSYSGSDTTSSDGSASFDCLRASDYIVEVSKRSYVVERFGDRRALRMSATVREGQLNELPVVVLRRLAAAVGTVADEHGEPMEGVTVRALAVRYVNGRSSTVPAGAEAQTDDRGQFRVYGLQPGAYLLAASVDVVPSGASGDASAYVPSYFPGTADAGSAEHVRIEAGDVTGLDLLFAPSPAARVSGVALDSEGHPVRGRAQLLVSQRSGGAAREPVETPIGAGGEFVLSSVPPGDYVVHAIRPAGLGLRTEIGSTHVSITRGSPPPLTIRTSPGITIAGRIVLEDAERRSLSGVSLTAFPSDFDRAPFPAEGKGMVRMGDGSFYFTGLHGAIRIAMTLGPDGWYLKSTRVGGIDVTDASIDVPGADGDDAEIVISTAGASLTGRTSDPARVDDYAVIVFSVDRNLWGAHSRHLKLTPSSPDGTFRVSGLAPGAYWAAALDPAETRIDNGAWQDPAFLDRLAVQASRVTFAEGERRTVTLRLAR